MSARIRIAVLALAVAASCYTVVVPESRARLPELGLRGEVELEPKGAKRVAVFHSGVAGLANRYEVQIGEAFARYARKLLGSALAGTPGEDAVPAVVVRAELESATVLHFAVHLTASFEVELAGEAPFSLRYVVEGPRYFEAVSDTVESRAVVRALQRSAHDALVLALREFAEDLRERLASP